MTYLCKGSHLVYRIIYVSFAPAHFGLAMGAGYGLAGFKLAVAQGLRIKEWADGSEDPFYPRIVLLGPPKTI